MEAKNVVIIGDGYVGKTCILNSIKENRFEDQIPNVYDDFEHFETFNGKQYRLKFIDTAGQEEYSMLRKLSYKEANLFLLCFAIDDIVSFDNLKDKWVPDLEDYDTVPVILVGTKADLRNNTKCITKDEIVRFQRRIGAVHYVECSAKLLSGIEDLKKKVVKVLVSKDRTCVVQ